MNNELIIAAYGSHNASVAMYYKGNYTVVEVERWLNKKNAGLITYLPAGYPQVILDEITEYLLSQTDRSDVDVYMTNYSDLRKVKPNFNYKKHVKFNHHEAHAATAFYQSPFHDALTFTFDGGGDAGFFNVYRTSRNGGVQLLEKFNQDLGFAYMIIADHLKDIRRDPLNIGNLVYAGKLMGLCSYGNIRDEWVDAFTEFYETFNYFGDSYIGGAEAAVDALPRLMERIGVEDFTKNTRFEGQFAWDLAATTQYVFEQQFFKFAEPYFQQYPDLPVTLAGGCALNVILNKRILDVRGNNVFVPPNTSDCGIAVGGILLHQQPEHQVDLTYSGIPLVDSHMFSSYIENGNFSMVTDVSTKDLANFISLGNIVGVINGNSEHGPRALGNRSIICNPVGDMKDILNEKVKDREWYRPFAPVVRLEDAPTYFDFPEGAQSRHMTYVAEVRDEWKETIPAITHEDGTGRLQTVTQNQNPFLYELLTEFSNVSDHSVLLNTSFNVNGKPILSRLSDALSILQNTQLDAVYYNGNLVFRKHEEEKFTRNIISENIKPLDDTTTVYLLLPEEGLHLHPFYKNAMEKIVKSYDKCVIIASHNTADRFKEMYPTCEVEVLEPKHMYYHEMMVENFKNNPNAKRQLIEDIEGYSPWMKLLWVKPIMHKNYFRTKNHLFISLSEASNPDSIATEVNMLTSIASDDDKILIKTKDYESLDVFNGELSQDIDPTQTISPNVVWGSLDNIEWLSVTYEGLLLQHIRQGHLGVDEDFLMILFNRHYDRFKVYGNET